MRVCESSSAYECRCTVFFPDYFWAGCSMPTSTRLGWNAANTGSFTPLCIIAPEGGEVPATVVVVQRRYPTQVWGEVPGLKGKCRSSRAHAAALQAYESRTLQVRSNCGAVGMTRTCCGKSLQLLKRGARSDCPCGVGVPCRGAGASLAGDLPMHCSPRCGIVEVFKSLLYGVCSTQAKAHMPRAQACSSWLHSGLPRRPQHAHAGQLS